ncbi:MAG: hypothetical protein AB7U38_03880 [Hyphomicrobiales bacterium]
MARDHDRDNAPEDTTPRRPARKPPEKKTPAQLARERELDRRARFAQGIARSEFGRFYWDEAKVRGLREAMARKPGGPRKPKT